MRVIKNSHSGVGGIATASAAMCRYVEQHPEHFLSLVYRDSDDVYEPDAQNIAVHKQDISKNYQTLLQGVRNMSDFHRTHQDKIRAMRHAIEEDEPDVALCAGSFYHPWFLLQAAKERRLPAVIRYDGIIEMEGKDTFWHELGKDFVDERFFYIFPSALAKRTVEEINGIELPNAYVIHCGIDEAFHEHKSERGSRMTPSSNGKPFSIAFIGRMRSVKNPEYISTLLDGLNKYDVEADVIIVTDSTQLQNPSSYTTRIISDLQRKGVRVLPHMSAQRLAAFYRSVDLVISPSRFETFGNVPLESMVTGTPALINRNMGVREVFQRHSLDEYIVDFDDVESTIKKIKEIKENRIVIPPETSSRIIEQHNWDNIMRHHFIVLALARANGIRSVLNQRSRSVLARSHRPFNPETPSQSHQQYTT